MGSEMCIRDRTTSMKAASPTAQAVSPPQPRACIRADWSQATHDIQEKWGAVLSPTFQLARAKTFSLGEGFATFGGAEHGTEWGTVIHSVLEALMKAPQSDVKCLALTALEEQELSDMLADEVVSVVQSVRASEIWQRAQKSERRFVEVPFQRVVHEGEYGAIPILLRGVIDLVFREPGGWVIVDYKTHRQLSDEKIREIVAQHTGQLRTYKESWEKITKETVAEAGFYFIATGRYEPVITLTGPKMQG